jgi:hypothetical protein
MSAYPPAFVTACCDLLEQGKAKEDIIEYPNLASTFVDSPHLPIGASTVVVALLSAIDYVELASYRAALSSA